MHTIPTKAGDYTLYPGSQATRKPDQHLPDKWYFEPANYVGFTVFSDPHDTLEEAKRAALECGDREELLQNEIGGGG
jgi:hypothetical protein